MTKWTDAQLEAIQNRGGAFLVSAAAGSGKTAVLVERIIGRVVDEKVNINQFLIVTFTNMAAKEMKEKIIRAIAVKISENPKDMFLREQLSLVHKAQITTVHSFCFNMIRENFMQLKISPDFKISTDLDTIITKKECLNTVISDFFLNITDDFKNLVDILGENNIEDEMLKIYDFMQSNTNPNEYIENVCKSYENLINNGFDTTVWYEIIVEKVKNQLNECLEKSNRAVSLCKYDDLLNTKNSPTLLTENQSILQFLSCINENNWDLLHNSLKNMSFATWKSCNKSENIEIATEAHTLRDEYKAVICNLTELVYLPLEDINEQSKKMYSAIRAIKNVLFAFEKSYIDSKISQNVLDFNDAEHKMIELLMDKDTKKKSKIAYEISNRFTEIMVDEYQDTNEIQDTLFKLLSKNEENIFMVGDVKQSIYRFRLADPTIFLEKTVNYKKTEEALEKEPRKVALSQNFRSRSEVLDATNFIFSNIMSQKTGGIDYKDEQKLYLGAKYPEYDQAKAEFCLIDYDKFETQKSTVEIEAEVIAKKIVDMVENKYQVFDKNIEAMRDVNFSDIVILLRSASSKGYTYKKALENVGVNIDFKEGSEQLFGTPEVSNVISLLRILDNNLLDVDVVAVMRSQIFAFSDDEIAKIRVENQEISIFDCIRQSNQPKAVEFLEKIEEIKKYSQNNSIFRTIWYVIHRFDLLAKYALMTNGPARRSNILRFLDFINTFDEGYSVFDFINFLDKTDNKKIVLPSGLKSGHSVKIMTMHASKGLEFPVVFLADIGKEFNKKDLNSSINMHNKLGIGLKYTDDDNILTYPSLMQKAIKLHIKDELTAEEMRVLYVAMTRAKEKLFVMCTLKKAEAVFEKWLQSKEILECNSYHQWFGMNIVKMPSAKVFYENFKIIDNIKIDAKTDDFFQCVHIQSLEDTKIFEKAVEQNIDMEILDFKYNYKDCVKIPSKLTATGAFSKENNDEIENKTIKKPKFLQESKLSATERGIAHHVVMQFINFDNCKDVFSIKKEITRLYNDKFITKAQFECIRPQKIDAFINSKIGDRLKKSDEIIREFNFSVLTKAKNFYETQGEDDVLLQGVIDCMFIENDKIVIIDYKTDFVNDENIDKVSSEHQKQLEIYAKALEEIYKKEISEKYLYYFRTESFYKV